DDGLDEAVGEQVEGDPLVERPRHGQGNPDQDPDHQRGGGRLEAIEPPWPRLADDVHAAREDRRDERGLQRREKREQLVDAPDGGGEVDGDTDQQEVPGTVRGRRRRPGSERGEAAARGQRDSASREGLAPPCHRPPLATSAGARRGCSSAASAAANKVCDSFVSKRRARSTAYTARGSGQRPDFSASNVRAELKAADRNQIGTQTIRPFHPCARNSSSSCRREMMRSSSRLATGGASANRCALQATTAAARRTSSTASGSP